MGGCILFHSMPLKPLSDFFANSTCENRSVLRSPSVWLHPLLASPYKTFKKLLKIQAQPQNSGGRNPPVA